MMGIVDVKNQHRKGNENPLNEPPCIPVFLFWFLIFCHNYSFVPTLNLALLDLGFSMSSSSLGTMGFLGVASNSFCGLPYKSVMRSPSIFPVLIRFFTNRSSRE